MSSTFTRSKFSNTGVEMEDFKKWDIVVINKLRNDLRAAVKDKQLILKEFNQKGNMNNIEFKNALRKLGIGISGNEIN